MKTIDEIKKTLERYGYYASDEILYDTFNALCLFKATEVSPGQDIFAICLDGPPGAGKTSFAKNYTRLANEMFGNVEFVDYQCDPTTGKSELFEDINISAAIAHKPDEVNIPGYLIKAIQKVNEGKKVVLFIDEYDKAREETDSFFLQLLQDGKINANQHGDLVVKDDYKNNLQVIFCRNDMREELSGPLTRRLRILSLDYITPDLFYEIAYRNLVTDQKEPVNEGILNLVSLIYQSAYNNQKIFSRLPAASEMMIAISDANRLMSQADAPQNIIYKIILKNMFKSKSDLLAFEALMKKAKTDEDKKLNDLLSGMQEETDNHNGPTINEEIASKILKNESGELLAKKEELQKLIDEYKIKFDNMEKRRQEAIKDELERIQLEHGELVTNNRRPNVIKVFEDETAYIKRGMSVFDQSTTDWTDIANVHINGLSHHALYEYLIKNAADLNIKIFEDGVILEDEDDVKLAMINDFDENENIRYRFLCNYPVIPSKFIKTIENFANMAINIFRNQAQSANMIIQEATGLSLCQIELDSLVFHEGDKPYDITFTDVDDNLIHVESMSFIRKNETAKLVGITPDVNLEELKKKAKSLILERKLTNEQS